MRTNVQLKARPRDETGKGAARKARAGGRVPAILYGRDQESVLLTVDAHEATSLFTHISVENTLVDLQVEGLGEFQTLVREVQAHPFRPEILHVDFYAVQEGVTVEVNVPIHLMGTPVGVKDEGGILEQPVHDVPLRCVPSLIPEALELDVSGLGLHESLQISDLVVEEGIEILLDPERTVCTVIVPRVIEEPEPEIEEEEPELVGEEAEEEGEEVEEAAEEGGEEDEG